MSRPQLSQYSGEGEGKGRSYKHPFRAGDDDKPLSVPSVTTILKLEAKDALIQWAADQSVKWCSTNWHLLGSRGEEDAFKSARYRWREVRDERAFVGTGVHDYVEAEHTKTWNFPELDAEQLLIIEEWRKFNEEWIVEPYLSEFTVWSLKDEWAGTADGLWRLTNRETGESFVAIVDLKTSKNTWDAHRMQTAALANGDVAMKRVDPNAVYKDGKWPEGSWVETEMPEFDKVVLLHLRAPEFNEYGNVSKPGIHELIEVHNTDAWYQEFLGYRAVRRAQDHRKALEKKRELKVYGGF